MKHAEYNQVFDGDILAGIGNSPISPTRDFHIHDHYEIFLFLGGKVNGFVDQYSYPLQRGDVLLFNNHEIHKIINLSTGPYERLTIHFKAPLVYPFCTASTNLLACFQNRQPGEHNLAHMDEPKLTEYMDLSLRLIDLLEHPKYGSEVLALTYLIQLLVLVGELYSHNRSAIPSLISSHIQSAMSYIDNHLQLNLSLEQIAAELGIDKYYLSHMFKQQTGGTIYRYVLLKKIALAKQLLTAGTSVSDTCYQTGFNDYANFIRTFKNITGVPPGKYGKQTEKQDGI
ncbi:helix-turn-helix domain-containing protein [Paenibacillus tianjinensis]|uniref:Helix-turn-helix domain-containing protein n=1 Tax=Paenibacillus tianjinensis TaxID=2810347 RepID=A0ABX7LAI9_9BACL|nr:AraC family transcriptional regulator [Paenibacillus tianjinensis]QSF43768.1 helix-turn-helix domain-containing protein [Paenibacillus tianjinensis]